MRCARSGALVVSLALASPVFAELSPEELAKLAQNPVGNLISVPFQDNVNLNYGPQKATQNVLNIQPVLSQPGFEPSESRTNGIGDLQFTAFLSPANPGEWIWGAGAIVQAPTHSNSALGNDNWGLGPSFVVLHLARATRGCTACW
ncbi:MAG: hypothetical protein U1F41_15010 [Burkholderiales bacterium]